MARYIYQYDQWPDFTWDDKEINGILGKVRHLQGKIFGQMEALGFSIKKEALLSTLTLDVLKSSEIEGELLNYEQVRSSIARKLGIDLAANKLVTVSTAMFIAQDPWRSVWLPPDNFESLFHNCGLFDHAVACFHPDDE